MIATRLHAQPPFSIHLLNFITSLSQLKFFNDSHSLLKEEELNFLLDTQDLRNPILPALPFYLLPFSLPNFVLWQSRAPSRWQVQVPFILCSWRLFLCNLLARVPLSTPPPLSTIRSSETVISHAHHKGGRNSLDLTSFVQPTLSPWKD